MPSFVKVNKKKNGGKKQKKDFEDPVEEVIDEQQKTSIMKVIMGCDARKTVFGVSDQVPHKPACAA